MFSQKNIFLFLLIGFWTVFNAQTTKDSLLNIIKKYKINDTIQCERILSYIELEEDTDRWMAYNDKLYLMSKEKLNSKISKAEIKKYNYFLGNYNNNKGYFFVINKDYNNALLFYKKAEVIFKKLKDKNNLALVYHNIGTLYDSKGETFKVLNYYNQVLKLNSQTKDSIGLSNIYADLGRFFGDNGSETKALEYYIKSLKISDKIKDEATSIRTKRFMVIIYTKQKEYELAIKLLHEGLIYFKKNSDIANVFGIYHNLSFIYKETNRIELMKKYNDLALNLAIKNKFYSKISIAYSVKRDYFLKTKQIDSAFKYSKLEYQYSLLGIEEPYHTKSKLQLSNLFKLKNDYFNAKKLGVETYKNAQNLKYPEIIMLAAKNLKEIYIATNEKSKALEFAQVELKMNDSLNNLNTKNSAIKSLFAYETEKKEATIKELNQKKKITELESNKKSILLNSVLISVLALALIGYFLFSRYKNQKKNELLQSQLTEAKKLLEAEKKATDSELKALKSQMNPHFIFNALNSIQEQFMYGDKIKANLQLSNFTYLTRQILEVSGKKNISIATEIDILTKYLELEKMRFAKDFEYTITIAENLDEDYVKLPPMLIQPFVENSVKHGLLHKNGLKTVAISFDINPSEEFLICSIIDNGIGREKSAEIKANSIQNHSSFSTKSIQQRLDLLNENLQLTDLILYSDIVENEAVCGTKVVVKIPII